MRVFDCFPFFNELDILEIRFNELNDVVDYFVLVESSKTHTNLKKPLHFENHKQRFAQFLPKIRHIIVDDMPEGVDHWKRENHQRRCITRGLDDAQPDDVIMVSDADEIPTKQAVRQVKNKLAHAYPLGHRPIYVMRQKFCLYYLNNGERLHSWEGTHAALWGNDGVCPQIIKRTTANGNSCAHGMPNSGWHFSFLGDQKIIREKINGWVHQEFRHLCSKERVDSVLQNRQSLFDVVGRKYIINDTNTLPDYVQANLPRFNHLLWQDD